MRMHQRSLKDIYILPRTIIQDDEGCTTVGYGSPVVAGKGSMQPLSGQVAQMAYGETLPYMMSIRLEKLPPSIKEKDGITVGHISTLPDYEVISIKAWANPVLEVKKL